MISQQPAAHGPQSSRLAVEPEFSALLGIVQDALATPPADNRAPIPWIESFGNQHDLVARLGMLAPNAAKWKIAIDGPRYERCGAWGHLLNEHYLSAIEQFQKAGRKRGGQGGRTPYELVNADAFPGVGAPRLFSYINGGTPATC